MHPRLTLLAVLAMLVAACASHPSSENAAATSQPSAATAVTEPASSSPTFASGSIDGRVLGARTPIANSTVTLWAATSDSPKQVAQAHTDDDGKFAMTFDGGNGILYLVATGGEPAAQKTSGNNAAIVLMTVLGSHPPAHVVVNELTTVASVWTAAQFLNGTSLRGNPLSLSIAAGDVPNLANVETGGLGSAIQDSNNSTETPTLAMFGTLADVLAACVTDLNGQACSKVLTAVTPPASSAPADTLAAMEAIALHPTAHPEKIFALLNEFYPLPAPPSYPVRPAPYVPYLSYAPSAWILGLKFTGGGIDAPGKLAIDRDGNVWTGDNFIVGAQNSWTVWNGNLSEFAPNGRAISPITTGFTGGGVFGPGFGTAIDQEGRVWVSNNQPGDSVSVFDNHGRPLSPPDGINFNHQLGALQGVLVAPNGDVWILDSIKNQLLLFPKGDITKGRLVCKSIGGKSTENPCKLFNAPFHLTIDAHDQIWVSNAEAPTVVRFPAADPTKAVAFKTGGYFGKGVGIDSRGNVWIANTAGKGPGPAKAAAAKVIAAFQHPSFHNQLMHVFDYLIAHPMGSVSMMRPDGTLSGPFYGGGQSGSWAIAVDGNDNIFISNIIGQSISELCGVRTETCPAGLKTGDPISPPGGFVGGGMLQLTDIAIDPAGNVWVADNWRDFSDRCFKQPPEAVSTKCGGNGLTVFYGLAKPVGTPQIGLPHAP